MRQRVATREELDALPGESVIRDAEGGVFEQWANRDYGGPDGHWFMAGDDMRVDKAEIALPAIVLWRPDEDEVDGDEREALVQILDREGAQSGDCGHEPGCLDECQCGDCRRILEGYADAILAARFRRQVAVTVSRAQVVSLAESYAFDRWPDQTVHDDPELVTEVALPLVAGWLREAGLEVTP